MRLNDKKNLKCLDFTSNLIKSTDEGTFDEFHDFEMLDLSKNIRGQNFCFKEIEKNFVVSLAVKEIASTHSKNFLCF